MDSNYIDDIFGMVDDMDDLQEILDEYDRQKRRGEQDYYDWKWRNQPAVPDCMLDKIVEEFDNDYEWNEIQEIFEQKLEEDFGPYAKIELKKKLDTDLPVHGIDKRKPKV